MMPQIQACVAMAVEGATQPMPGIGERLSEANLQSYIRKDISEQSAFCAIHAMQLSCRRYSGNAAIALLIIENETQRTSDNFRTTCRRGVEIR